VPQDGTAFTGRLDFPNRRANDPTVLGCAAKSNSRRSARAMGCNGVIASDRARFDKVPDENARGIERAGNDS
jgi:hypothetical protein